MVEFGAKVAEDKGRRLASALSAGLAPGEDVWMIVRANGVKPMLDHIVVTSARVMGVLSTDASMRKKQIFSDEFQSESVGMSATAWRMLTFVSHAGASLKFGDLSQKSDVPRVLEVLVHLREHGDGARAREYDAQLELQGALDSARFLDDATVISSQIVGGEVSSKALEQIRRHARAGERPWLVLSSGAGGVMAAFDDRLLIIKTGALTSMMAGSFGGGRTAVFDFAHITGVEYNSGMLNGVLEVLTPSYQGTSNKDFWRGTTQSRNVNSDDPFTLSNTLPLDRSTYARAQDSLNALRTKIAESRRPSVVVQQSPVATNSPAARDISELAKLHKAGVLSDEEFADAKSAIIARLKAGN
ncbi:hypothetical protein LG324_02980 [Phycicoccus jejuensis]|uniref:hypothetical protein n=1 Tax=Phycicoccus jejuensis TaxID=367299 RepID=UPI00384CAC3F